MVKLLIGLTVLACVEDPGTTIVGTEFMEAAQVWAALHGKKRIVDGEGIRLHRNATFTETNDPLVGTLDTEHAGLAAWLAEVATRGVGYGDDSVDWDTVIDPSDLQSPLLFDNVLKHDLVAPLLAGADGRTALADVLQAERDELTRRRDGARAIARARVGLWSDRDWERSVFVRGEEDEAADALSRDLFHRHLRRERRARAVMISLLEQIGDAEAAGDTHSMDSLIRDYIEVFDSGRLNTKLGVNRQVLAAFGTRIDHAIKDRVLGYGVSGRLPASNTDPATGDPTASSFWQRRSDDEITPERLLAGPWFDLDEALEILPGADEVLTLRRFRDKKADGMHPSVAVRDEARADWKAKFYRPQILSGEPIMSRLFFALGYNTQPTYYMADGATLEARAVEAAYRRKNHIFGFISPYRKSDVLAPEDVDRLGELETVQTAFTEMVYKDGPADSVGPWGYNRLNHAHRREVRAVGMVISWLLGSDYKFNNVRLDVIETEDDVYQVVHRMSDVGSGLKAKDPALVPWVTDIDPNGPIFHNNRNNFPTSTFDQMDRSDADWAVRLIGSLSEDQLLAAFAAGSIHWPVTRLYAEKFMARRDDLVKKFGLDAELGLLRPDGPDMNLNVVGDGELTYGGHTFTMSNGDYNVVNGEVVPVVQVFPQQ